MERLLADAQKLTGVKYDINNLSDVYEAIHAIQENLDITGTTAKEAAETFTGSFNAMKAAAQDFLGRLSLGMDIKPSLEALAQTTSTFLVGNFIPMVVNILKELPNAIVIFITAAIPLVKQAFSNMFNSIDAGIFTGFLANVKGAIDIVVKNFDGFGEKVSSSIGKAKDSFSGLGDSVKPILGKLSGMLLPWADSISQILSVAIPAAIDFFSQAFAGMASFLLPIIGTILDMFWQFGSVVNDIIVNTVVPAIQQFSDWISQNQSIVQGFGEVLGAVAAGFVAFKAITGVISVLTTVKSAITGVMAGVKALFAVLMANPITLVIAAVAALAAGFVYLWQTNEDFRAKVIEVWTAIVEFIKPIIEDVVNFIQTIWGGLTTWWSENNEQIKLAATTVWEGIVTFIQGVLEAWAPVFQVFWEIIKTTVATVWENIKLVIQAALTVIQSIITAVTALINGDWNTFWNAILTILSTIWNAIVQVVTNQINAVLSIMSTIISTIVQVVQEKWEQIKTTISTKIEEAKTAVSNKVSEILSNMTQKWNEVKSNTSESWENIKQTVSDKINGAKDALFGALQNILSDIRQKWDEAKQTTQETFERVVEFIKSPLENLDLYSIGSDIISGLFNGISNAATSLYNKAAEIAGNIKDKIASAFNINSPSRWMRDFIGKNMMIGWEIGLDSNANQPVKAMTTVIDDIQNSVQDIHPDSVLSLNTQFLTDDFSVDSQEVTNSKVDILISLIQQMLAWLMGLDPKVVLDSGELVGSLIHKIDMALGDLERQSLRGN